MGYARAGYDVTGVDLANKAKRYPFDFIQGDAIDYLLEHGDKYDIIHASPPCQAYTEAPVTKGRRSKVDLVGPVRDALRLIGKPYVIENTRFAPLINPMTLCGTMFGIGVIRHRIFETWPQQLTTDLQCNHVGRATGLRKINEHGDERKFIYGAYSTGHTWRMATRKDGFAYVTVVNGEYDKDDAKEAMGIDWDVTKRGLDESIPPAYTEYIGKLMRPYVGNYAQAG